MNNITTKKSGEIFVTSDTHFGHKNIIKFSNRPYENVEQMNKALIDNWNSVVGKNDIVYHLGDVSFANPNKTKDILDQLNGKIILIRGNHDQSAVHDVCKTRFESIVDYAELKHNGELYIMLHYPIASWRNKHRGSYHLYGHCHGSFQLNIGKAHDVGVDVNNYIPVHIDELTKILNLKEDTHFDHHQNNQV
jgi:calcineurin-like phosphoesterase family protein